MNEMNGDIDKQTLILVKQKALRKGVWFKALSRIERGIMDLTIRCVDRVRKISLIKVIVNIIAKLQLASRFLMEIESKGRFLAERASHISFSWGNESALKWRYDPVFIRYLGLVAFNAKNIRFVVI